MVPGRTGTAYARWLKGQDPAFVSGVKHASLDPFRGYANAIRDELPDAVAVLDAFHVVKLGTQVVDEARRRVQQDTLGQRGHKDDPCTRSAACSAADANTSTNGRSPSSTPA